VDQLDCELFKELASDLVHINGKSQDRRIDMSPE